MRALVTTRVTAAMAALSLIVAGVVVVGAPAYAATPIQVTSTTDSWGGDCDSALQASPVTLRNAICVANVLGGTQSVSVPAGTYALDPALGPLAVGTRAGSNITIEAAGGAEVAIESDGTHRVMTLDPAIVGNVTVRLRGLLIKGGVDNTHGGGAIIGGSYYAASPDTLILEQSQFSQNQANTDDSDASNRPGGAIQFIGGNLIVTDSVFEDNSSGSSPGGAIAYQATDSSHSLSITGSTFTQNTTRAVGVLPNGGAAVVIDDQSGLAASSIAGSSFVSNVSTGTVAADARGAAVWLRGGTLNLHQSTIIENSLVGGTTAAGAAVHVEGDASLTAHHNRLLGNIGGAALYASESVNAANNWWGCATGPGTAGCETVRTKTSADRTPWLTLRATADPVDIPLDEETTTVTASLLTNSAGQPVAVDKLTAFEGLPITWTKPLPSDSAVAAHSTTLSNGTATATYTKNSAQGAGSVTATVDNAVVRATLGILYPPRFTSANHGYVGVDWSRSFTVTTDAYHPATVSYSGFLPDGTLPEGVTFQPKPNGTAVFSGPAADGTGGVYAGELSATNSVGADATQPFTLTIVESPEFTSADTATLTYGKAGSFTIKTDGYPAATISPDPIFFSAVFDLIDNGDGTATVSIAADANTPGGPYWLHVEADNDFYLPVAQVLTVQLHRAPTVTLHPLSVTVNSSTTATFTAAADIGYPAPNVRWQVSTDDGLSYTEIPGATQPTLAFTAGQGDDGNLYRAVFANSPGMMASQPALLTVGTPPIFESAASTTFTAEGGTQAFAVTTSAVPHATITGAGLPSWLTLEAAGPGAATLTGSPPRGSGGAYDIVLTAGNAFDPDATQAFTLTVHEAPLLAATSAAAFSTGILGNVPIAASPAGFPLPTAMALTGTLPAGLTFTNNDDGTAAITGTPDAGAGGIYTMTVTAENTVGRSEQTLTITVAEPPIVTSQPAPQRVVAGNPASFDASAAGYPAPSIQWQVSTDGGTGFSDLPGETATSLTLSTIQGMNGYRYRAVFTSTNGTASTDAALLVVGTPASITSGAAATFIADAGEQRFAITAVGTPFPTFVLEPTAPSWLSIEDDGTGTPTLVGTPPAGSGGDYAFTVTADNGFGGSDMQNFTLDVIESPRFLSADAATFTVGSTGSFSVTTAAGTPTGTTLSMTGTLPTGVSFSSTGGTATITGEPEAGTGAAYPLLLTASNGSAPDTTQAFTLTVTEAPVVTLQPAASTVNAGNSATFTATAAGFPTPTVSWEVSTDGGTTFTPIDGENTSTVTIAASQSDDGNLYHAVFTNGIGADAVTEAAVLRVGTAPTFTNLATTTFTVGTGPESFAITTSGIPNAALSLGAGAPTWVIFTDNGDGTGSVSAEPAAGTGGVYAFDLVAGNGFTPDAAQQFTLIVNEAPQLDATGAATFSTAAVGSTTITATVGYPAATTLSVTGTLPGGVTFTDNLDGTATISGRPSGSGGSFPLTVTASNGAGTDATQAFTLTVTDATVVTQHPADATVASGTAATFTAAASGFPAPAVQWQVSTDGGATFADVVGATATTLTFTAAQHQNGHLFRAAFSGHGAATSDPALLTVGTPAQILSAAQVTFASGAGTQTVTLSASGIPVGLIELSGAPSWLTLVDHADGTATLRATPPAGSGGDYPVTVSASNGFGAVATQLLTVVVSQTGGISSAAAATFTAGVAGSSVVTMAGGHPAVGSLSVTGSLPAGIAFTDNGDGTATISGTPNPGTGGRYLLNLAASYGASPAAVQQFTLTVNETPAVTSPNAAEFVHGVHGSFTITTGGYPDDATVSLSGDLPAGLAFVDNNDGTATVSGITTEPVGVTPVTVTADNTAGVGASQTLTISVVAAARVGLPLFMPTSDGPLAGVSGLLSPGQTITVSGAGFAANAPVTVGIYSVPTVLAHVFADNTGRFTATITVPAEFRGSHTIVATGLSPSGEIRTLAFGVSVAAASGLPVTGGGDATAGGGSSLLLLLIGAGLLMIGRLHRRRRTIPGAV